MLKILKWTGIVVVGAYVALVIYRMFVLNAEDKTAEQVKRIHATRLTIQDVMGEHLPPEPPAPYATVQGVDANANGIRDDVELAIFKEYPNSARTRAVLLQYALALQMEVTQELVNTGTVVAVAQVGGKASSCIGQSFPRTDLRKFISVVQGYSDFVEKWQLNTSARIEAQKEFYEGNLDSYSSLDESCDIELSTLPN